ncbi:hypothetical protein C8R44DRAFT_974276 [Mycena epipterygia]|nr:hypothetical protein C8R44DRAFT_974276 [Mycena epipterygia]
MDSQLTLVTASPPVSLVFSHDSMTNASLLVDSTPRYTISSNSQNSITEIRAAGTTELLAQISRKEVLPDTIAFVGVNAGKEMRLSKWLRKTRLLDGSVGHVIETEEHGNFILKPHRRLRLALFRDDDLETPLAHWQRPSDTAPPALVLQAGTRASVRPQIIAAFVVQEFRMRMEEKAGIDRAGVQSVLGSRSK